MAWSRISSKVIATLPLPVRLAADGLEITDAITRMCTANGRQRKAGSALGVREVGDDAARLATAYRGPYNGTLPRLSGRSLKACWNVDHGSTREPGAEGAIGQSSCQRKGLV